MPTFGNLSIEGFKEEDVEWLKYYEKYLIDPVRIKKDDLTWLNDKNIVNQLISGGPPLEKSKKIAERLEKINKNVFYYSKNAIKYFIKDSNEIYKINTYTKEVIGINKERGEILVQDLRSLYQALFEYLDLTENFALIHANLLKRGNVAVIIFGNSKSGKTYYSRWLESKGYKFISDDIVLYPISLNQRNDEIVFLPYPDIKKLELSFEKPIKIEDMKVLLKYDGKKENGMYPQNLLKGLLTHSFLLSELTKDSEEEIVRRYLKKFMYIQNKFFNRIEKIEKTELQDFLHFWVVGMILWDINSSKGKKYLGGAGANTAIALSNFWPNIQISLISSIGNDYTPIIELLNKFKIKTDNILILKDEPTGKAYWGSKAEYNASRYLYFKEEPRPPIIIHTHHLLTEEGEKILKMLKTLKGKPYVYVDLWGFAKNEKLSPENYIEGLYCVAMNEKESIKIFNTTDIEELYKIRKLLEIKKIILKKGHHGSFIISDSGIVYIPALGNIFGDYFGTGDAYIAGFAYADVLGYGDKISGELGSTLAYLKIKYGKDTPWYRNPLKVKKMWKLIKEGFYYKLE